jgi:radical SAM protein with 4Fe4S-binding SPASM domain
MVLLVSITARPKLPGASDPPLNKGMSDSLYCAAPWRGLHINFRGDVKTCCAGDPNMLGNLNQQTIEQVLQGSKMQEIRQTIKNGELHPEYCSNCIQAERYGRSERHWHNNVNPGFDVAKATLTEHVPSIIDVRWNTTCNLSCNYCGPFCSSKWAAMMKFDYKSGARPYYEQVCEYIEQHRDSVKEVALVGGEPLLLPENERLLDVIPEDCIVTLITNMNVDFERNAIVKKLQKRQRVGWSMSFDNVGERFEYVRSGGNWKSMIENVSRVKEFVNNSGHWTGIHAVYNIYNCTRLIELRTWADKENIKIHWQTLHHPEYLDPGLHNLAIKKLALNEITQYLQNFKLPADELDFFSKVQDRMLQNLTTENIELLFLKHINDIETKYHTHDSGAFQRLWPELADLIGK